MLLLLSSCEPGGREREWMEEKKKNHALGHLLFITKCKSLSFRRDLAEDYAISLLCTCITYMYICECRYICRYFWVEIEQYQHTNTFFFFCTVLPPPNRLPSISILPLPFFPFPFLLPPQSPAYPQCTCLSQ